MNLTLTDYKILLQAYHVQDNKLARIKTNNIITALKKLGHNVDDILEELQLNNNKTYTVNVDYSNKDNQHRTSIVIKSNDVVIFNDVFVINPYINMYVFDINSKYSTKVNVSVGEYLAIINALDILKSKKLNNFKINLMSDNKTVVEQINFNSRVNSKESLKLNKHIQMIRKDFKDLTFKHVKRNENKEADYLAKSKKFSE